MDASEHSKALLPAGGSLLQRLGVRGRLLLAFLGISAFAVIAAAAAMYSFDEVGKVLGRITEQRVPAALASLELSRQAERIVTAAPAFLAATTRTQHQEVSGTIVKEVERLDDLLAELEGGAGIAHDALAAIAPSIDGLQRNLTALDALVASRLDVAARKEQLLRKLSGTNIATQRLVAPGVLVMDSKLAEWRRALDTGLDAEARRAAASQLADEVASFMPQQKAQIELSAINDTLIKAAAAETSADLPLLAFPLRRSLAALEAIAGEFDDKLRPRLLQRVEEFRGFMDGPDSIIAAREQELTITAHAEALLAENIALSRQVGDALDRLVGAANRDIGTANREARAAQRLGSGVLIGMVLLSLLSSGLIVWLYVDRNLIARLTALSSSMLAIAGGNLRAPLPAARGGDEISEMARALTVFRDTAVEVEENNLRQVAQARQRLIDAIESISEGFAFYGADDRLQLCNTRYRELLYGDTDIPLGPGMPFETILRRAVGAGLIVEAVEDPESYVQKRLARHRDPGPPSLQRRADGRCILIAERKVAGGGTVAVYSDITELKHREMALEEANRRTREAAEEIGRKHRELEALSSKLAKYLSPQVYDSIFEGRQEVKLASQRKKLTVFFSDIAGFTETTDKMESEDVTQLLNQYLTEMSQIAMEHGATIDKYVGDAIMIFFGDPETRGVRADALACVRMAIAMQERMEQLGAVWRDSGIENPIRCRIGVHTGYCTVGNFGSEDRMDYTIIGGAVNLASRLEHEAPPGGILISYETYAHVKDQIRCAEMGRIEVRGIGHPVAIYRVLGRHADLADGLARIRSELPHLRLDADPELMSADERRQAAALLQETLQRLGATALPTEAPKVSAKRRPAPPSDAGRRTRSA